MIKLVSRVGQWHDQFFALISYLQSPFLLIVRLYWGWQLAQSGWGKLHHLPNVTEFFASLGLPMPMQMAVFIACVEFANRADFWRGQDVDGHRAGVFPWFHKSEASEIRHRLTR